MGPATTMKFSTAMKSASTMEVAPSAFWAETAEPTTAAHRGLAAESITMPSAFTMEFTATAESVFMPVPTATVKRRPATIESATAVEAMEPRTRANKHATSKIIRAVVAVRRARVWGIPVVAIGAYWGRAYVGWAKLNSNLRMCGPCYNHEKPEQNSVL